jgi:hypothetical protein
VARVRLAEADYERARLLAAEELLGLGLRHEAPYEPARGYQKEV